MLFTATRIIFTGLVVLPALSTDPLHWPSRLVLESGMMGSNLPTEQDSLLPHAQADTITSSHIHGQSSRSQIYLNGGRNPMMVPAHPLDVKPLGNAFTTDENIKTAAGSFALLPDELITQVMEWLNPSGLLQLGSTCKALYAFSRQEDLWKMLYLG